VRPRRVDIAAVARRVVEQQLESANEKGLRLEFEGATGEAWGQADETATSHVLRHLVGNAIKFTSEGEVRVVVSTDENEVRVAVHDTGIGVPREARGLVFEEFRQVDQSITRRYGGAGIGLSVVSRLVNLQGGTLGLKDRPGGGSTFWFGLPAAAAPIS